MNRDLRTFAALVRRELWESRGFWMVPTVIASLMTLAALRLGYELLLGGHDGGDIARLNEKLASPGMLDSFAAQTHAVAAFFMATTITVGSIMMFVVFFYLLDSLYSDRRDKSVLFWRSMPVTDVQTVGSKLATALLAGPALTLGVMLAAFLVWGGMAALFGAVSGVDQWWIGLNPLAYAEALAKLGALVIGCGLILAPLAGWLMLASAWAPRAPFLWAVLPPVAVSVLEGMVFGTQRFARLLADQSSALFPLLFDGEPHGFGIHGHGANMEFRGGFDLSAAYLAEPRLWVGLAIAAGFVACAIVVRRYRDEAAY